MNDMTTQDLPVVANLDRPMTVQELTNQSLIIHHVLKTVMIGPTKDNPTGIHYGIVPGTERPTLYQAGAEKICATFRLAPKYDVEDLGEPHNNFYRYRVKCSLYSIRDGYFVGSAMGEASSLEEKYQWERALSKRHFELTDPSRRRIKFKKNKDVEGGVEEIDQVQRNCADLANTVLKIAVKRSFTSATKNATAASDILDVDLDEEAVQDLHREEKQERTVKPKAKAAPAPKFPFGRSKGKSIDDETVPLDDVKWMLKYLAENVGNDKRKNYERQDRAMMESLSAEIAKREQKDQPSPKDQEPMKPLEHLPMDDEPWADMCQLWFDQHHDAYVTASDQLGIDDPSALPKQGRNAFQDRVNSLLGK